MVVIAGARSIICKPSEFFLRVLAIVPAGACADEARQVL